MFSTVSRCFKDCTADGQCRTSEDYLCERVTTASLNKGCYPASSNTAGTAIGGACAKDHDCFYRGQCFPEIRGGQPTGWTGGYCLRYGCRLDGFCPAGALCGDDVCYASCVTSAGCRTQYHCAGEGYAAKICAPASALTTALVGTECTANTDCGTNGVCYRGVSEGYCTGFCSADRVACPTGSGCVDWTPAAGSVYSLCFRECSAANTSCGRPDLRCELGAGAFFGKCVNTCSTTQACPSGSICDGANCRANCTASATCTSDHHCAGIGAVGTANCYPRLGLAGINVGAGCVAATDCTGGDGRVCITYTGGYCSGFCSVDAVNPRETCPTGSRCVAYTNVASGRQYSLCFKSCQNNADCGRPDHRCELSGTFLGTCVKNCTPSDAGTSTECGAGWACSQVPGSTGFACQP